MFIKKSIKSFLKILLSIILISNLVGCQSKSKNVEMTDVHSFLYKIVDEEGRYSYLLGTCHPGRNKIEKLDEQTEQALKESDNIWLEVTLDNNQAEVYNEYLYKNNIEDLKLTSELEELKDIYPSLKKYQNLEQFNSVTISTLALNDIMNDINADNHNAVDLYIYQYAVEKNNLKEIEGLKQQFSLISEISQNCSHYILENLKDKKQYILDNKKILDAYYKGDVDFFKKLEIVSPTTFLKEAQLYKKLLCDDRNIYIANTIKNIIEQKNHDFIAIGVRHLYGDDGLLKLLKENGYRIIPISNKNNEVTEYEN